MSGYHKLIIEASKCPEDLAGAVEEMMRDIYGCLDGLDRKTFMREARKAYKDFQKLNAEDQAFYRSGT